jgi:hypothetical protein
VTANSKERDPKYTYITKDMNMISPDAEFNFHEVLYSLCERKTGCPLDPNEAVEKARMELGLMMPTVDQFFDRIKMMKEAAYRKMRQDLSVEKLSTLKQRAREAGIEQRKLDEADDDDDTLGAVIELIIEQIMAKKVQPWTQPKKAKSKNAKSGDMQAMKISNPLMGSDEEDEDLNIANPINWGHGSDEEPEPSQGDTGDME